jgi:tetratricopeptide (TPR) repeat protein
MATMTGSGMSRIFIILAIGCMVQPACIPGAAMPARAVRLQRAADVHLTRGRYPQAMAALEEALDIQVRALGENHLAVAVTVNNLGVAHLRQGDYERALPLLERALQIRRNTLGSNHGDVAFSLRQLADLYRVRGEYQRALLLYREALQSFEKALGPGHRQVATTLNNLALLYHIQGDYERALPLLLRALAIRKRVLGDSHPDVAESLNNVAEMYRERGDHERALPLYQQALRTSERALGRSHVQVGTVLNNLGSLYYQQGDYERAVTLLLRALKIRKQALGENHPDVALILQNLADVYTVRSEYERALPLYWQALRIFEKTLGEHHIYVALALSQIAALHYERGDYEHALPLLLRALDIRKRALGDNHVEVATSLHRLAATYRARGENEQALPLYQHALRIQEQTLGPNHFMVGNTLNSLALLHQERGEYEQALSLLLRAQDTCKHIVGDGHVCAATSLNNLAEVYRERGEYGRAVALLQQGLQTIEETAGKEHPLTAMMLGNLANLHYQHREYDRALPLFLRALEIQKKAFPDGHPSIALALNNLAEVYVELGKHEHALPLFRRSLQMFERSLGKNHPHVALVLSNLGKLHFSRKEHDRASPLFLRALEIRKQALGDRHPDVARSLSFLGLMHLERGEYERALPLLEQARETTEKSLGKKHPETARMLDYLTILHWAMGRRTEAIDYWQQRLRVTEESLEALALATSDDQKQVRFWMHRIDALMAVALHLAAAPDDPRVTQLTMQAVVRRKALALGASARELQRVRRQATNKEVAAQLDRLARARSDLANLLLRGPEGNASYRTRTETLWREIDMLEAQLSRHGSAYRAITGPVTVQELQARLPAGTALVEIVLHPEIKTGVLLSEPPSYDRFHYAAYVLTHDGPPRAVDLGNADTIGAAVQSLRTALALHRADVRERARALDALVMQPVRALLGDVRQVYLSPDVDLNLVPFEALLDEQGRYLVERYSFTYLNSGRELLDDPRPPTGQPPLVIADPAYDDTSAPVVAATAAAGRRSRDMGSRTFPPLPGTAREAAVLRRLFPTATVLTGKAATEAALSRAQGPFFLHVGSHGFFLPDQELGPAPRRMFWYGPQGALPVAEGAPIETPLVRSALALAGANRLRSGNDDGILTALELSSMDLDGTQLVVLSACDTGVGHADFGEGVFGLRRALVLAGAETQVVSLWKVDDETTAELMAAYYGRLLAGKGRSEALHEVQRAFLRDPERAHPYYWASFIVSGDPSPLPKQPRATTRAR